ncbi:MAG: SIR2 family protein [Thermoproteota archaeon]|nr:SIR2 family protein [Thermoproteota archaeon]
MSDNKQPKIGLFLGAGASVPFGKPTTKELRAELIDEYSKRPKTNDPEGWLNRLLYSILSFDKFEDIEHVLQSLKEIDDFFLKSQQYGGRYLQSIIHEYSPDIYVKYQFSEYLKLTEPQRKRIEEHIFHKYRWERAYDEALGQVYEPLFGEIKKYSKDVIHVFTTNYDRAIEMYCSKPDRKCRRIDGFRVDEYTKTSIWDGNFDYPLVDGITNVCLYKLHGSLNWKKHESGRIEATIEETPISDPNYVEDMLIYPTLSPKGGQEFEPYKTIREKFKKFMDKVGICIVIGFSFRDEHINSIFSDFLKFGKRTLIVVSRSAGKNIEGNLLGKAELARAKKTSRNDDKKIKIYDLDGSKILAINYRITARDAEKIVTHKIGSHLSSPTAQRAP